MADVPLDCRAAEFDLADEHYLNCAYMAPLSRAVQEAGFEGIRRKARPREILVKDFFFEADEVRRSFAGLIGAEDPSRVAIVPAVSYAVAIAAANAQVRNGQEIVVVGDEFPSDMHAWRRVATEVVRMYAIVVVMSQPIASAEKPNWPGGPPEVVSAMWKAAIPPTIALTI